MVWPMGEDWALKIGAAAIAVSIGMAIRHFAGIKRTADEVAADYLKNLVRQHWGKRRTEHPGRPLTLEQCRSQGLPLLRSPSDEAP
jgi:hypothetical protein